MKVVILGRRQDLEPLEILYAPETDPKGLASAQKRCDLAIKKCEQVWVSLPMGKHTADDVIQARKAGKTIRFIGKPFGVSLEKMEKIRDLNR